MYNTILLYFLYGLWTKEYVRMAVTVGWITEEEYEEIVQENF